MLLWQLFLNGVLAGGQYSLVAAGFGLIYRTTRFFNLAHGAVFMLGAYLAYLFHRLVGVPIAVAVCAAVIGCAISGALMETVFFKPIRRAGGSDLILLIAATGLFTICQNAISAIFGDQPKTLLAVSLEGTVSLAGARVTIVQLVTAVVAFALCIALALVLWRTRRGNTILAVGADSKLAESYGIDSNRAILQVFAIGSGLAGLAGVLVALDTDITPVMGYQAMLTAVVAVIVGGARNPIGWLIGAVVLGVAQNVGVWRIGSQWQDTIAFSVLLIFLVFRPTGIVPSPEARG